MSGSWLKYEEVNIDSLLRYDEIPRGKFAETRRYLGMRLLAIGTVVALGASVIEAYVMYESVPSLNQDINHYLNSTTGSPSPTEAPEQQP